MDCLLAALGRQPAVTTPGLNKAGIALDANGLPIIDGNSMRAGGSALCFARDIDSNCPLMHEAANEGAIAGFNAAHHAASHHITSHRFRRRTALSIVYNVGILTMAASGTVPPIAAAFAMLASSISVIAYTSRLTTFRRS